MKYSRPIFILLGAAALVYMISDYGLVQLGKDIETVGAGGTVLLVLTFIPTLLCYAAAWSLLTEWEMPLAFKNMWRMTRMMAGSIAWNNLTPFLKVGGEPAKVFMLGAYVGRRKALMSTIIYNVIHLLATLAAFVIVAFLLPALYPLNDFMTWASVGVGTLGTLVFVLICFFPFLWKKVFYHRFHALLERFDLQKSMIRFRWATRKSNQFFKRHYVRVIAAFSFEVFARFIEGLTFYLAFYLLRNPISMATSAFLDVGRTLVDTIFFFVPYQVGSREQGVQILLSDVFNHGTQGFLTAVFLYRFVEIAWVLIGYIFWVRSRSSRISNT